MPDERTRSNGLEARMTAAEHRLAELHELVDGQETWSHRKRLHKLESDADAARLASAALDAYHQQRDNLWTRVREWGSFALALVAVVVASHPWG